MNILVLDDDKFVSLEIKNIIDKHYNDDVYIDIYYNLDENINLSKYDIFFLDIDIDNQINQGFEFASLIKSKYENKPIVFVTSHNEYMKNSFKYRPFRYVEKNNLQTELEETLHDLDLFFMNTNKYISINYKDEIIRIKLHDITYITKKRNKTIIYTLNNTYISYISIKKLLKRLGNYEEILMKINSGIIVAKNHITGMNLFEVILDNDIKLPYSRSHKKEIIKLLEGKQS